LSSDAVPEEQMKAVKRAKRMSTRNHCFGFFLSMLYSHSPKGLLRRGSKSSKVSRLTGRKCCSCSWR